MSRIVYVDVTFEMIIEIDDEVDLSGVLSEMDYDFALKHGTADILNAQLARHEVTKSRTVSKGE